MANRQMAFQWSPLKVAEVMEALNKFVQLAGLDEQLAMLETAMERCKLEEKTRKEFRVALEIARGLVNEGRQLLEIRKVVAWRSADVTQPYTLQVEYTGRVQSSVLKA